jgi:membrane associated rhomboid family serine protease
LGARPAKPYATVVIAAATAGVHLWLASRPDAVFDAAVDAWGARASKPVTFVTSLFLHESKGHLLLNLLLFLVFAPAVEKRLRGWGLALVYGLSGVAGVAAHLAWAPSGMLIGASGAISGVLGAHAWLRPWGKGSIAAAALWALANLAGLLVLVRGGSGGISYLSHLGGMAAGALIAAALPASRRAKARKAF